MGFGGTQVEASLSGPTWGTPQSDQAQVEPFRDGLLLSRMTTSLCKALWSSGNKVLGLSYDEDKDSYLSIDYQLQRDLLGKATIRRTRQLEWKKMGSGGTQVEVALSGPTWGTQQSAQAQISPFRDELLEQNDRIFVQCFGKYQGIKYWVCHVSLFLLIDHDCNKP
ncbi:uncharacterized protein LOC141724453 isoform X1 [Apium graveolens]|uniref:uncharacterized protein LOC141724453 isoform X1 n=1 Tax=Apium graveolens TaxID=4045 RepID=UPI003D7A7B78